MDWTHWLLIYLLLGFFLGWMGGVIATGPRVEWYFEFMACLLWPISIVMGILTLVKEKRAARRG